MIINSIKNGCLIYFLYLLGEFSNYLNLYVKCNFVDDFVIYFYTLENESVKKLHFDKPRLHK